MEQPVETMPESQEDRLNRLKQESRAKTMAYAVKKEENLTSEHEVKFKGAEE